MSIIVFDGDDTLWHVEHKYSEAYSEFFAFLFRTLRHNVPDLHTVYRIFFAIEKRNAEQYGIRRGRVAASMVETYQAVTLWAERYHGEPLYNSDDEAEIRRIGDIPFNVSEHHFIKDAEETLARLRSDGHTLCLLTKYDRNVWPEKARHLGTARFFRDDNIVTVDGRKTPGDFYTLVCRARADTSDSAPYYTVGNSKGDMVPVVHSEFWRGFYIPRASSVPLESDVRPENISFDPAPYEHVRVITLRDLPSILPHFVC